TGRVLRRPQPQYGAASVAEFLTAAYNRPAFERDNPSYEIYTRLDDRLGFVGWVWSRAINGQAAILRLTWDSGEGARTRG
ncbi:MAG: hypothetical protein ACKO1J_00605, partial [Tagaea sp.]